MNHSLSEHSQDGVALTYDEVLALLPAFVLGALESEEMLAVDAYVEVHQELMARLNSLEATSAQLIHASPLVLPPETVKSQLMARVQADLTTQSPATATAPHPLPSLINPMTAPAKTPLPQAQLLKDQPLQSVHSKHRQAQRPQSTQQRETFLQTFFARFTPRFAGAMVGAALCLLFAIALTRSFFATNQLASQLSESLNVSQRQVIELQNENVELQQQNEWLEGQIEGQDVQLATLIDAQQTIVLAGTDAAPNAQGLFYTAQAGGVLVLRGLAPLADTETYQLWLIPAEGDPISAGLVAFSGPESIITIGSLPSQAEGFANVGLSIEPSGGSESPTGPIVLLG